MIKIGGGKTATGMAMLMEAGEKLAKEHRALYRMAAANVALCIYRPMIVAYEDYRAFKTMREYRWMWE